MKETRSAIWPPPRIRAVAFGGVAIVIGLSLALIALEVTVRAFELGPSVGLGTVDEEEFERIPGLFTPEQDFIDRQIPQLSYPIRINRHGYRGEDIPAQRADAEFRVLLVGDSFTFDEFVTNEESLPAKLEAVLQSLPLGRCGTARVINAGIGGTTIVSHAEMARRGLQVDPDLVVLTFSENDITDLQYPMWDSVAANRKAKSRFPLSIAYPILRHTATWNYLLILRAKLNTARVDLVVVSEGERADATRAVSR